MGKKTFVSRFFGESHGAGIGMVLDGLPAGTPIDREEIRRQMARRAPGGALATSRKEADEVEFLSGIVDDVTCGKSDLRYHSKYQYALARL